MWIDIHNCTSIGTSTASIAMRCRPSHLFQLPNIHKTYLDNSWWDETRQAEKCSRYCKHSFFKRTNGELRECLMTWNTWVLVGWQEMLNLVSLRFGVRVLGTVVMCTDEGASTTVSCYIRQPHLITAHTHPSSSVAKCNVFSKVHLALLISHLFVLTL